MMKRMKKIELIDVKAERFEKDLGLGKDLAKVLSKSDIADLFEEIVKKNDVLEEKIIELQGDKKSMQRELDDKMRLIKERREH